MKAPPVTRQAIKRAANDGKIIIHGKGRAARIDLQCPLTIAYLKGESNPGKATTLTPVRGKGKAIAKKTARTTPEPDPPVSEEKNIPPDSPANADKVEAFLSKEAIKEAKLREEHEKLKLANAKTRGDLVERELLQGFIHRLHEIDNGQWKTLGFKISSDVGAVFGSDDPVLVKRACGIIDAGALSILKQVKREANKFLKKIGAEKIPKEAA